MMTLGCVDDEEEWVVKTWKGADPVVNESSRQECADASIVVVGVTWRNVKSWRCKRCDGVAVEVGGERGV